MSRYRSDRKTAPGVRGGKVLKKNRHAPTRENSLRVGRLKGNGRHVIRLDDVWKFIRLLPHWKRVSADLDVVYLSGRNDNGYDGLYEWTQCPTITLEAWNETLTIDAGDIFVDSHRDLFCRLGVEMVKDEAGFPVCHFSEESARAYQLLHVFLHELGHHEHRISRGGGGGSEEYAEAYAYKWEKKIWPRYCEAFHFRPVPSEID